MPSTGLRVAGAVVSFLAAASVAGASNRGVGFRYDGTWCRSDTASGGIACLRPDAPAYFVGIWPEAVAVEYHKHFLFYKANSGPRSQNSVVLTKSLFVFNRIHCGVHPADTVWCARQDSTGYAMAISRSMIAVFRLSDMQRVFFHRLVSPPPPTAALSGEYKKPAVEILADARKAGAQARSFHMVGFAKGTHPDDRGQMVFALTIAAHQGGEGTITSGGQTWSIIRLGSALYLKSSDAVYRKVFGDKAKSLFGKWLTVNANTPSWRNYTTLTEPGFTNTLSIRDGKPEKDALTTLNGTPAIKLVFPDGYQLYVAAKGPPYPLLGTDPIDPRARTFRFSRWNAKVTITAPASTTTLNH